MELKELSKEELEKVAGGAGMTPEEFIKATEGMTVLELADLVNKMEETFGFSAAAPVATAKYCLDI